MSDRDGIELEEASVLSPLLGWVGKKVHWKENQSRSAAGGVDTDEDDDDGTQAFSTKSAMHRGQSFLKVQEHLTWEEQRVEWVDSVRRWEPSLQLTEAVLSVLYVLTFIVMTYRISDAIVYFSVDVVISSFFVIHFFIRVLLAWDNATLYHELQLSSVVDIITIVPVIPFGFFVSHHTLFRGEHSQWAVLRMLFPFRVVRAYLHTTGHLRALRSLTPLRRSVMKAYAVVIAVVLFTTLFIQATPWIARYATFHDALYNVMLMAGTMGAIPVNSVLGELVVIVFIVVLAIVLPAQVGSLIIVLQQQSAFLKGYTPSSHARRQHVIVCGRTVWPTMAGFLDEILHPAYGAESNRDIVIVNAHEPSPDCKAMLADPSYYGHVFYIKGSVFDRDTLDKARLREAAAVFILADKWGNPDGEDARVILITLGIHARVPTVPVYIQLHRPNNKRRALRAGATYCVCIHETRLNLLAQSCTYPGLSTLLTNLTRSFRPDSTILNPPAWVDRYAFGMANQIYCVPLSDSFSGRSFTSAASHIYRQFQAVLIGVVTPDSETVVLNPGPTFIFHGPHKAIIVAQSSKIAHQLESAVWNQKERGEVRAPVYGALGILPEPRMNYQYRSYSTCGTDAEETDDYYSDLHADFRVLRPSRRRTVAEATVDHYDPKQGAGEGEHRPHIVVAGDMMDLCAFVLPLRSRRLPAHRQAPVVLLHHGAVAQDQWVPLSIFPDVFIVNGRPDRMTDLHRCAVHHAEHIVLLASGHSAASLVEDRVGEPSVNDAQHSGDPLDDAAPIMALVLVDDALHSVPLPTTPESFSACPRSGERRRSAIGVMSPTPMSPREAPTDSATLRTIVELRHNRSILLLKPNLKEPEALRSDPRFSPAFAAGLAYTPVTLDTLLASLLYNPFVLEVVDQLLSNLPTVADVDQLPVPDPYIGRPYGYMFQSLLQSDGVVVMGLYRTPVGGGGFGEIPGEAVLPFVLTNPKPDVVVQGGDRVFLLRTSQGVLLREDSDLMDM